jgi:DeoR family transcriptional regulator of aga operon
VIGAAGLSARWGLTELDDAEAEIQRSALERSDRVVVIADGSKVGVATNAVVAEAGRIRTLVTDAGASEPELDALSALGVEIVIAGVDDKDPGAPDNGAGPG